MEYLLLIMAFTLLLVGCGGNGDVDDKEVPLPISEKGI